MERRQFRRRKEECWAAAAEVQGRDPARWRADVKGHPVLKWLQRCQGPVCYYFDFEKCTVIQSRDFVQAKGQDDSEFAAPVAMSDLEMDMIERGVYGSVKKP